jgi:hypothetical protein
VALSASAQGAKDNTYKNPTVGLTLVKPADWHFMTAEQNAENLERTKLKDEQFQELVKKYASAPLVVITKYKEPYDDLNPSLKINMRPLGDFSAEDPKTILTRATAPLKNALKDFKIVTAPKDTNVSGLKAAYAKFHYSLGIPDGRSFPTCSEMWVVPRGKHFFLIGTGTRQDEKTGKREEIQKIVDSLKIER